MTLVAVVQMCPTFKAPTGNIRKAMLLAATAATAGAKIIVLPELVTTGYSFMSAEDAMPYAEVLNDNAVATTSLSIFRRLAQKHGVYIAWGLVEKDPGSSALYNAQVLVTPEGEWESYRKVNFFGNDFLWATPGRANPPILETEHGKIGLLICRDVRDKSDKFDSFYEPGDANIVVFSANWGKGGFPATAWMDFARSNHTNLLVANRYGEEVNNDFGLGGSCLISPTGVVQCKGLRWGEDCIIFGEI